MRDIILNENGYYWSEKQGRILTRIDLNRFEISSEEAPILENDEQKIDDNGELIFETIYTATEMPIEIEIKADFDPIALKWNDENGVESEVEQSDYSELREMFLVAINEHQTLGETDDVLNLQNKWSELKIQMEW